MTVPENAGEQGAASAVQTTAARVVDLEGVSFAYDGVSVLDDVTFAVREGELVSMIGPNGGGKTTILKLVLGLLKPDSGQVRVFGAEPSHGRRRIGYMPQYTQLDPKFPATVMDVVLMGRLERRWGGPYSRSDRDAALEALEHVGLADQAKRLLFKLSGGQRQRVLIARALASEPDLLLMDEPTANVDVMVETRLVEILGRIRHGMTIMMVSHDLGFVSNIVDRVLCVSRCVRMHPVGEINADLIREMYGADFCMVRHDHLLNGGGDGDA